MPLIALTNLHKPPIALRHIRGRGLVSKGRVMERVDFLSLLLTVDLPDAVLHHSLLEWALIVCDPVPDSDRHRGPEKQDEEHDQGGGRPQHQADWVQDHVSTPSLL